MGKRTANTLIYFCLAIGGLYLQLTGKIGLFLHPRMFKYITVATMGFLLLALFGLYQVLKSGGGKSVKHVSVYVPVMVFLIILASNPSKISSANKLSNYMAQIPSQSAENQEQSKQLESNLPKSILASDREGETSQEGVIINSKSAADEPNPETETDLEESVTSAQEPIEDSIKTSDKAPVADPSIDSSEVSLPNVEGQAFLSKLDQWMAEPEAYAGKEVEIEGFVYREDFFEGGAFVAGRFLITCCAADSTVAGIYVEGEDDEQFDKDTWVHVKGTIAVKSMYFPVDDAVHDIVVLKDSKITKIEPYDSPYVYLNYQ